MQLNTQSSSRNRVKKDGIGDQAMSQLFILFPVASNEMFKEQCIKLINESSGKQSTKDTFISELQRTTSKTFMLQKVTNYFLAGEGKGV